MTFTLSPATRREQRQFRTEAEAQMESSTLEGDALDRAIKELMLELEIATLPEVPYEIEGVKTRAWLLSRALGVGLFLSVFAIGGYFIIVETHRSLWQLGFALIAVGTVIAIMMTVITFRTPKLQDPEQGWPYPRKLVRPGIYFGIIIAAVGCWVLWAASRHYPHVHDTNSLWHFMMQDDWRRHGLRKELEVVAVCVGGLTVSYNAFSWRRLRRLNRGPRLYDKAEMLLRIPNMHDNKWRAEKGLPPLTGWQVLAAAAFWQFAYAILFVWGLLVLLERTLQYTIDQVGPGWARFVEEPLTGKLAYIIIGVIVSPVARRPIAPLVDDVMRTRARRFVARHKQHADDEIQWQWYHKIITTPMYREMVQRYWIEGVEAAKTALDERSRWLKYALVASLAGFVVVWTVGLFVKVKYGAS